jgi:hypothetical protein
MIDTDTDTVTEGHRLVARVRAAAVAHSKSWDELVPNRLEINFDAEVAEEAAYADMAGHKAALREHICATYGLSIRELASLASN